MSIEDITINRPFFDFILPDKKVILHKPRVSYDSNNIIFRNILIFGGQGSGKTTTANYIAYKAFKKYGSENVNARISEEGDLELLMEKGLENKLVNILVSDNLTLRPLNKNTLMEYFRIRHKFKSRFNESNGYILSIMGLHRIHSIPVELRTTLDGIIIKDSSINPYDRNILKKFIGETHLKLLDSIAYERDKRPELREYSYFIGRGFSGLLSLPLVRENYLRPVFTFKTLMQDLCLKYNKSMEVKQDVE